MEVLKEGNSSKLGHKWIIKQELGPEGRSPTPTTARGTASIPWIIAGRHIGELRKG